MRIEKWGYSLSHSVSLTWIYIEPKPETSITYLTNTAYTLLSSIQLYSVSVCSARSPVYRYSSIYTVYKTNLSTVELSSADSIHLSAVSVCLYCSSHTVYIQFSSVFVDPSSLCLEHQSTSGIHIFVVFISLQYSFIQYPIFTYSIRLFTGCQMCPSINTCTFSTQINTGCLDTMSTH
jgi:hypothetical protein